MSRCWAPRRSLDFTPTHRALARIAAQVNESVENIGARRLQTVMEKLLEEISFEAEDRKGETDDPDALPPGAHIQTAERLGWMASAHGLPAFERYPG
jgi:hypothetical protein